MGDEAAVRLGLAGVQFVVGVLGTHANPDEAIEVVQRSGALRDAACEPLLGLLDHLGARRAEAYSEMLAASRGELTSRLPQLSQEALLRLLAARFSRALLHPLSSLHAHQSSFPFIGIEELRGVPLAVLERLSPVPVPYLHLASLAQLPRSVQRQVWENDGELFCRHSAPSVEAYSNETATLMRELDMRSAAQPQAPGGAASIARPPPLSRKSIRAGSANLRRLMDVVGASKLLYLSFINVCRRHFAREAAVSACSLRSQLLLAFCDSSRQPSGAAPDACADERCILLASELEACLRDGAVGQERLAGISSLLQDLSSSLDSTNGAPRLPVKFGGRLVGQELDTAQLAGRVDETPATWAADAAMLLRDPPLLHLLLHETVRTLQEAVARESVPKDDSRLCQLSNLLAVATSAHELVFHAVEKKPVVWPVVHRDVLEKFYPLLADIVLESQLRESSEETEVSDAPDPADGSHVKLVALMQQDAVIRKVALAYVIQRLEEADMASAKTVLLAAREAISDELFLDEGPFAATLARLLASLVTANRLHPSSGFWRIAVDDFLLRAVCISTAIHEEVLQLLLSASGSMLANELARRLEMTLHLSRRGRRQQKRRHAAVDFEYEAPLRSHAPDEIAVQASPQRSAGQGEGYASDGIAGVSRGKASADGVRATYARIRDAAKLNAESAPELFRYLLS